MFRLINKSYKKIKFMLTAFAVLTLLAPSYVNSDSATPYCPLEGTPLESCANYARYIPKDKELNSAYKALTKSLDKNSFSLLKKNNGNGLSGAIIDAWRLNKNPVVPIHLVIVMHMMGALCI